MISWSVCRSRCERSQPGRLLSVELDENNVFAGLRAERARTQDLEGTNGDQLIFAFGRGSPSHQAHHEKGRALGEVEISGERSFLQDGRSSGASREFGAANDFDLRAVVVAIGLIQKDVVGEAQLIQRVTCAQALEEVQRSSDFNGSFFFQEELEVRIVSGHSATQIRDQAGDVIPDVVELTGLAAIGIQNLLQVAGRDFHRRETKNNSLSGRWRGRGAWSRRCAVERRFTCCEGRGRSGLFEIAFGRGHVRGFFSEIGGFLRGDGIARKGLEISGIFLV